MKYAKSKTLNIAQKVKWCNITDVGVTDLVTSRLWWIHEDDNCWMLVTEPGSRWHLLKLNWSPALFCHQHLTLRIWHQHRSFEHNLYPYWVRTQSIRINDSAVKSSRSIIMLPGFGSLCLSKYIDGFDIKCTIFKRMYDHHKTYDHYKNVRNDGNLFIFVVISYQIFCPLNIPIQILFIIIIFFILEFFE